MVNTTLMASPSLAFLLATTLKGTVLLLAAGALCLLLRAAAHRHLVWNLTFVALLVLPLAAALMPPLAVLPWPQAAQDTGLLTSAAALAPQPGGSAREVMVAQLEAQATTHAAAPSNPTATPLKHGPMPRIAAAPASTPQQPVVTTERPAAALLAWAVERAWTAFAFLVWLTGMAMLLFFDWRDRLARRRLARTAVPLATPAWRALLEEQCQALGLRRVPQLLCSAAAAVPMTWGVIRPVILLPATAEEWPVARRRSVLLHELAHVVRCDALGLSLARAAQLVYWFNPLVWWAQRRLQLECEHAADDRVLLLGTRPSSYADHLLTAARALQQPVPGGALAMARPSQLPRRIRAILDSGRARTPLTARRLLVASAAAALLVVTVGAAAPRAPEVPEAPSAPTPPAPEVPPAYLAAPEAPLPPVVPSVPTPALAPNPTPRVPMPTAPPSPPTPALAPSPADEAWPVLDAPQPPRPALAPAPVDEVWPEPDVPLPSVPALAPAPAVEVWPVPDGSHSSVPTLAPSPSGEAWPVPDASLSPSPALAPAPADKEWPRPPASTAPRAAPLPERAAPAPAAAPTSEPPPAPSRLPHCRSRSHRLLTPAAAQPQCWPSAQRCPQPLMAMLVPSSVPCLR